MDPLTAASGISGLMALSSQVAGDLKSGLDTYEKTTAYFKNSSLIDVAQVARVEPIAIVDASIMHWEGLPDVMQSLQSQFAGYYLQAVNLLGNIGGVSVASKLAPLNPNRTLTLESRDWRMSVESYKHRLPTTHNNLAMALESEDVKKQEKNDKVNGYGSDNKDIGTAKEMANLSVGKMYTVCIKENGLSANIPVAIRLMVSTIPTSSLINLFTFNSTYEMDIKERYYAWKSGRLSFMRDLILCQDLIDKHRTTLINDKTGIYSQIVKRETNNLKSGLINRSPSLATASNIAVISTDTLGQIELKLLGKFSNFKVRQTAFETTNLMILAVVDKAEEVITFYYRGIQEKTQVGIKDIRISNKGNGPDVLDTMKAFMAGSGANI